MMYQYQRAGIAVFRTLLFCTALAVLAGPTASEAAARPKTHTVTIHGMLFIPASLDVNAGDTVIWRNEDIVPHTATSDKKSFNSGAINEGGSWKLVTREKGAYPYSCIYHPTMKGELIVH